MAAEDDWVTRCDWRLRSPEFCSLREWQVGSESFVAMELVVATRSSEASSELSRLWLDLPVHRNVISACARGWLRYAALDWARPPLALDNDLASHGRIATLGAKLTWIAELLLHRVPEDVRGWLACPIVKLDLEGEPRSFFVATDPDVADRLPPEVVARWPRCDERGLVFVVGKMLGDLVVTTDAGRATPLAQVIGRCVEPEPTRRFARLDELRDALRLAGGRRVPPPGRRPARAAWDRLEHGLGYLALGDSTTALRCFDAVLERDGGAPPARALRAEALRRCADRDAVFESEVRHARAWSDVASTALELERRHRFADALALYARVQVADADPVALELAIARCHMRLGNFGHALDHARRAARHAPASVEAHAVVVEALHRKRQHAEALVAAEAWIALAPDEARAHHARGRSLLALGQSSAAYDAFDRACVLGPKLLEAMLLRREAARARDGLRATIGTARPMTLELPEHLGGLRELLVDGRHADAVAMLSRPEHARDGAAQVIRAELLSWCGALDDALVAFDDAAALDDAHAGRAVLGKAYVMLEQDRAAEALALFERLRAERPELADALDGRARALAQLGRDGEAEQAFAHTVAAVERGSGLRVRSAAESGSAEPSTAAAPMVTRPK